MKVLILAAGYGTRLYPLIKDTAKPLLPVAGRPMIDYLVDKVCDLPGLTEIIAVTNNKFFKDFQQWAESKKDLPAPVTVINDGTMSPEDRLGAVGDIHFVLQTHVVNDDLFVLGGDNLFDYKLDDFVYFSQKNSPHVSIGLYDIGDLVDARKFGVVSIDNQGKVIDFVEKPDNPKSSLVAMCSYYLPKESQDLLLEYVGASAKTDKTGDYIHWLTEKDTVFGYTFQGRWFDIGSIETYREAQEEFKN